MGAARWQADELIEDVARVARVFLDEYLPQLAQRTPLTSTGSFVQHPDQSN
jgi:hypothetical protein